MDSISQRENGAQAHDPTALDSGAFAHTAPAYTTSVEELAQSYNFKRIGNEWHGANPTGQGATDDGYILNDDGTSYDRKLNQRYNSIQTAQNFNIPPDEYEPVAYYRERNGHNATALSFTRKSNGSTPQAKRTPVAIKPYDYIKEGALLFQTVRREYSDGSKDFTQRRPDGSGGWVHNLKDITPVLYNSDDVKAAQTVIICEGEKAADEVNQWLKDADLYGPIVATTNPMGADKWRDYHSDEIAGKFAVILPDNDEPGHRHAAKIRESLTGKAATIKVVELEDLPEKGDVVEYFENGKTLTDLLATIDETPAYIAPKSRFALLSILELFERPDPVWLVHGVLQAQTNSCLSAPPASFKSFIVLDIALSIAAGLRWCGRDVIQGDVIYICAEGASGMKSRIRAWCSDKDIEPPAKFHFVDDAVQIHDPKERGHFLKELGKVKPVLIVLDTLSLCALGLEENAAKDMNLFMDSVKEISSATGAHVLLVHHHSKNGGARGSSAIPAAVESEFELKRERETVTMTCLKQKNGPEFKPMTFQAREVEYDTWRRKFSLVFDYQGEADQEHVTSGTEDTVYNLLCDTFGASGASASKLWSIAQKEGIAERSFYRALKNLVTKSKKVDDGKDGQGGRGAIYRPIELLVGQESKASEVTAKLPMAVNGSNGSDEISVTAKLPPPL